jgi:hypothetical protein
LTRASSHTFSMPGSNVRLVAGSRVSSAQKVPVFATRTAVLATLGNSRVTAAPAAARADLVSAFARAVAPWDTIRGRSLRTPSA